jgi:hypothetical protein
MTWNSGDRVNGGLSNLPPSPLNREWFDTDSVHGTQSGFRVSESGYAAQALDDTVHFAMGLS